MHRHKIVPLIFLILCLINFLLAAPVILQEVRQACIDMADVPEDVKPVSGSEKRRDGPEKRWDKYSDDDSKPWQKRGTSSGSSPVPSLGAGEPPTSVDQGLALNPPSPPPSPQTQTGLNRIQDAASGSASPPAIKRPASSSSSKAGSVSDLSDENHPNEIDTYTSSDNYLASEEGGHGSSKEYHSDASSGTRLPQIGSDGAGSPGSSKSYPPWNRPGELASNKGGPWSTKSYPPSDDGTPSPSMNHPPPFDRPGPGPVQQPLPGWNPHDRPTSSSQPETLPKSNRLFRKTKNFLKKTIKKFKFWHRGPAPPGGL